MELLRKSDSLILQKKIFHRNINAASTQLFLAWLWLVFILFESLINNHVKYKYLLCINVHRFHIDISKGLNTPLSDNRKVCQLFLSSFTFGDTTLLWILRSVSNVFVSMHKTCIQVVFTSLTFQKINLYILSFLFRLAAQKRWLKKVIYILGIEAKL